MLLTGLKQVVDLLKGGTLRQLQTHPVCSPLSVITNQSGNKFLWMQKFKYEDLHTAMALFEPGEWMFAFDLKSGNHHIDVAPHHCKYLGGLNGTVNSTHLQYCRLGCHQHHMYSQN